MWQHKATIFTADSRDPLERDKIMGAFLLLLPCPYLGGGSNIKTEQTCVSWSWRVFASKLEHKIIFASLLSVCL